MVTDLPDPLKQNILLVMNLQQVTLLVLPDLSSLSAPFDTANYEVLVKRLHTQVSIRGKVLDWFKSYLRRRIRAPKLRFAR